jgi:hypothetical protein
LKVSMAGTVKCSSALTRRLGRIGSSRWLIYGLAQARIQATPG